jgi:hypothetical protein
VAVALAAAIGAAAVLKWGKATPPAAIDTPSAAVQPAPPGPSHVQAPEQKTKEDVASSVVPKPSRQAPKGDARPAAAAKEPAPAENKLASLVAAFLQDGEKCFRAKQYDCAIAKADAALQVEPGSAPARQLKTAAAEEQQRAIRQIKIE